MNSFCGIFQTLEKFQLSLEIWGPFLERPETFQVTQFSFVSSKRRCAPCHETSQLFLFLFPLQHIKRPALQNKRVGVLRVAFRARKVFWSFEKRTPGVCFSKVPKLFRVHLGWHNSLCIFKTKASRGTTLCPYIHSYSLYNM